MTNLSPMMRQYFDIKEKCGDAVVFFRLGDFYEMFFDDAIRVSKELELTLTGKECGQEEKAPMCGVPYHSCEGYIARLVEKGYKVAICDQVGDATGRGLVNREITRIITPGTIIESNMLDESKNNFICSVFISEEHMGMCFCDVSTGELHATYLPCTDFENKIKNELTKFMPREILASGAINRFRGLERFIKDKISCTVEVKNASFKNINEYNNVISKQFLGKSLLELNIEDKQEVVIALAVLINYLKETQRLGLERIDAINLYEENQFMRIDMNTRRNLELTETMRSKSKKGSLLWILDNTKTAMGKRLIRSYIEQPLINILEIKNRQDAVEELYNDIKTMDEIKEHLGSIYDLERLMTRIVYGSANARELRSLCYALSQLPDLKSALRNVNSNSLIKIYNEIDDLKDVTALIDESIEAEPPVALKEGNIIKSGYNEELDFLRGDLTSGEGVISKIELREKEKTGITKLKVGYNKVFGYYIEVSNSFKNKVPEYYIRKQTLANCERYITSELKALEGRILGARERSVHLEYEIFCDIRKKVASNLKRIQYTAKAVAKLDVLVSFATVAYENGYVRPKIKDNDKIVLKDSRHPVVEQLINDSLFVPNDVLLDNIDNKVVIITGPNMAGKSTYMRQVALITLMAQIGSFVPAAFAEVGVVDSIFTRVGASDDLASGQSTFMVEMMEVAKIMKEATKKSLIILDEIGRGTSTYDGMSIARAVVEYIADDEKLGAKTLFATHYHELTELQDLLKGVKNYNIAVKKRGDDIIFLRRIVEGGADDSYGIEVAKLAGVPQFIIDRAKVILSELESSNGNINISHKKEEPNCNDTVKDDIIDKLSSLDITTITPIESMNILFSLLKSIKG